MQVAEEQDACTVNHLPLVNSPDLKMDRRICI